MFQISLVILIKIVNTAFEKEYFFLKINMIMKTRDVMNILLVKFQFKYLFALNIKVTF